MSIYLTVGRSVGRSASLVFEGPVRPLAQLASSCPRRAKSGAYEISRIWQQPAGRPAVWPLRSPSCSLFSSNVRSGLSTKLKEQVERKERVSYAYPEIVDDSTYAQVGYNMEEEEKVRGFDFAVARTSWKRTRTSIVLARSHGRSVGRRPPRGYFSELNFWPSAIPPESVACEVQSWGAPLNLSLFSLKLRWRREAM